MRRLRRFALCLFLFYTAFIVGISLHTHSGQDAANGDCRLCQVSRTLLIQPVESQPNPEMADFGAFTESPTVTVIPEFFIPFTGRAPPLS